MFSKSLFPILAAIWMISACAASSPTKMESDSYNSSAIGQQAWISQCKPWDDWEKAGPPFHIYGSTYYVGTCGIAALLITDDAGHILIDGASRNGGSLIAENVKKLGFDVKDIKILLHSHEHYDHVGGLADIQARSGARLLASKPAAPVLASGETDPMDPQAGMHDPFAPVKVDGIVKDGETVRLGEIDLRAIATPGHTLGALSWAWQECQDGLCKNLVYMDSLSPVSHDTYRFSDHPDLVTSFRRSADRLKSIPCDIALTPHPAGSRMFKRIRDNNDLTDRAECGRYADNIVTSLDRRLKKEASSDHP